jgi:hypothetical protein
MPKLILLLNKTEVICTFRLPAFPAIQISRKCTVCPCVDKKGLSMKPLPLFLPQPV